jgi:hypothetical protein
MGVLSKLSLYPVWKKCLSPFPRNVKSLIFPLLNKFRITNLDHQAMRSCYSLLQGGNASIFSFSSRLERFFMAVTMAGKHASKLAGQGI